MKVVAIYIEELPQKIKNMIEALQREDFEALAGLAHNLKGSSGLAGFPELASQAAQVQQAVLHKRPEDLTRIVPKIIELCRLVGANVDDLTIENLFQQGSLPQARTSQDPIVAIQRTESTTKKE